MNTQEIVDIIKTKSKLDLKFEEDKFIYNTKIIYNINNNSYEINIKSDGSKFNFECPNHRYILKYMSVSVTKNNLTSKRILAQFNKLIKWINKTDTFLEKKDKHSAKIKRILKTYIKNEYNTQVDLDDNFNMIYPSKMRYFRRKKTKYELFDTLNNKLENFKYDISVDFSTDQNYVHLKLEYKNDQLILLEKTETYKNEKELTKVIRLEKLRNINLKYNK